MKIADIKLGWTKSASADVSRVEVVVTKDGTSTTTEVGPEVESFQIEVEAMGAASFTVITYDSEGLQATSDLYSFTLGDLTAPQPATSLFHTVLGVRDVADPVVV